MGGGAEQIITNTITGVSPIVQFLSPISLNNVYLRLCVLNPECMMVVCVKDHCQKTHTK